MSQALEQIKKLVESNNPDLKTPEFVVAMAYMIYKEEKMRWLTNAGIVTASGSTQSALKNSLILFAQQNHNDQKFNEFINKPILNLNDYNKKFLRQTEGCGCYGNNCSYNCDWNCLSF